MGAQRFPALDELSLFFHWQPRIDLNLEWRAIDQVADRSNENQRHATLLANPNHLLDIPSKVIYHGLTQ